MAYESNVFVNCPFDSDYHHIFQSIIFAAQDCGFTVRCAREVNDSGDIRINKILSIIAECKFGIHDISMAELDKDTKLARFNMPLELGIFIGCKHFGSRTQKGKSYIILDKEPYRFQKFISDISGQDIDAHKGNPELAIRRVRDFLASKSNRMKPGASMMHKRYLKFRKDLPKLCKEIQLEEDELTFLEYSALAVQWINTYPHSLPN